jgi:hypothetical protein
MRTLVVFAAALVVSACSAPPPRKTAPLSEPVSVSEVDPALLKKGYKVMKRDGKIGYCRAEQITGTQFKKTVCLTADQIREQARSITETSDAMQRQSAHPGCITQSCSP